MNKQRLVVMIKPNVPSNFMCVYKIRYGSRYFYIGSTKDLNKRLLDHAGNIKRGKLAAHLSLPFDGRSNIHIDILEVVLDPSKLLEREFFYIKSNKRKNGFLNKHLKRPLIK